MRHCAIASDLLDLRRRLLWEGVPLGDYYHATDDRQFVRDRVFATIGRHDFSIQATIMEKSKARPSVRESRPSFYGTGWQTHLRHGVAEQVTPDIELLMTAATIGTGNERAAFQGAINDAMRQVMQPGAWRTVFCPAAVDPCVQVADYCAWAIQRKYERGDCRSYDPIKDRITHEHTIWSDGADHYY